MTEVCWVLAVQRGLQGAQDSGHSRILPLKHLPLVWVCRLRKLLLERLSHTQTVLFKILIKLYPISKIKKICYLLLIK